LTASGRACRHQPRRVQRIDVDFQEGTAIIRWTFTDSTAKINLARGKARSRERIRASHKDTIDAPVEAQCGQVVAVVGEDSRKTTCSRVSPRAGREYVVAGGGLEPRTEDIFKFFLDLERLWAVQN
jgi:hypothetical protein